MCLDTATLYESGKCARRPAYCHAFGRRHSADVGPLAICEVLSNLVSSSEQPNSLRIPTSFEMNASILSRASLSVILAMKDHECGASVAAGSMSRCIFRECSPVLKAASAASTPAGTNSAIVLDEETAAAANEPVHTPIIYGLNSGV